MALLTARWILVLLLRKCLSEAAYIPVVMMHGMDEGAYTLQRNVDLVKATYPGIYVKALAVYEGMISMTTHIPAQLEAVISAIQEDPQLSQGFTFYGESQGALLARAYVTESNNPPVHNLVALNGPQAGVGECPNLEFSYFKPLCGALGTMLDIYAWPRCAFCDYWKGEDKASYLYRSNWLADVNNDRAPNQTRRNNMLSLNKYMATMALQDEIVQPPISAWHSFWSWDDTWRSKVIPFNETEGFTGDLLGLKTLYNRGDFILNSFDGGHLGYTMEWWTEEIVPLLGTSIDHTSDAIVV